MRALYDWVVTNTYREPKVRGCGEGDIKTMLETGNLGGKCADLNALLPKILDTLFNIFPHADRGCILFNDATTGKMVPKAMKHRRAGDDAQLDGLGRPCLVDVGDQDDGTTPGEELRGGPADTAARAGDHNGGHAVASFFFLRVRAGVSGLSSS